MLIVDRAPERFAGGSSRVSAQGFLNPTDPSATASYVSSLAQGSLPFPDRVTTWAEEACKNSSWLNTQGISTVELDVVEHAEFAALPGSGAIRKSRTVSGDGLWRSLLGALHQMDVDVLYNTFPKALMVGHTGRIEGVRASWKPGSDLTIRASRGVVIATGGFAASDRMLRRYAGVRGPIATAGSTFSTGGGLRLASAIGARMGVTTAVAGPYAAYRPPGCKTAVPVRFIQRGRIGDALVVDGGGRELDVWRASSGWGRQMEGTRWSSDNLREVGLGWIFPLDLWLRRQGGTDEALRRRGMDVGSAMVLPLTPTILNTQGGPVRDERGRLWSREGQVIRGLFSAGELGSIFPSLYQGSGNLADCLVSGRLAARAAFA